MVLGWIGGMYMLHIFQNGTIQKQPNNNSNKKQNKQNSNRYDRYRYNNTLKRYELSGYSGVFRLDITHCIKWFIQ